MMSDISVNDHLEGILSDFEGKCIHFIVIYGAVGNFCKCRLFKINKVYKSFFINNFFSPRVGRIIHM